MVSRMVSRSIYNLKIDTIYMYNIPFDRSFLQRSHGIRHVMPSTDTKPELTAKASIAQPVSQPAVYANGINQVVSSVKYNGTECPIWKTRDSVHRVTPRILAQLCKTVILYILLTVPIGTILDNNQIDAFFNVFIYFTSLDVSGNPAFIIRRINCISTSSGMYHSV
jgi:hypothetical protein